ncbi:hypothetical protein BGZ47_010787 [Haplosporangium gracile]|nr:hypothetical protein BGZ47_010787 [Haplosporangium gracile]
MRIPRIRNTFHHVGNPFHRFRNPFHRVSNPFHHLGSSFHHFGSPFHRARNRLVSRREFPQINLCASSNGSFQPALRSAEGWIIVIRFDINARKPVQSVLDKLAETQNQFALAKKDVNAAGTDKYRPRPK